MNLKCKFYNWNNRIIDWWIVRVAKVSKKLSLLNLEDKFKMLLISKETFYIWVSKIVIIFIKRFCLIIFFLVLSPLNSKFWNVDDALKFEASDK